MKNNLLKRNKKQNILEIILFLIILIIGFLSFYSTSFAYTLLEPLGKGIETVGTDMGSYLDRMFKLMIGMASALAILMIVIGGIQYISSFVPSAKENAKNRITAALLGLVLALASWLILYTINPDLLNFNLDVEKTTTAEDTNTGGSGGGGTVLTKPITIIKSSFPDKKCPLSYKDKYPFIRETITTCFFERK